MGANRMKTLSCTGAAALALLLTGCAGGPQSIVTGPTSVPPAAPVTVVERVNNGAIFQPGMTTASLFSDDRRPRAIGDTLKVDISESLKASNKVSTDTSRDNKVASKGPGTSHTGGLFNSLLNMDASASGSDAFKGSGSAGSETSFNGRIAVSVINVLPNGHLLVAGERSIAMNGGVSTLRFSGLVNPKDIRAGNVVASADAANARLEVAGRGDVSEAGTRTWLQRVLTNGLSVW
jgi:flagellar L-ring protein FlgH